MRVSPPPTESQSDQPDNTDRQAQPPTESRCGRYEAGVQVAGIRVCDRLARALVESILASLVNTREMVDAVVMLANFVGGAVDLVRA